MRLCLCWGRECFWVCVWLCLFMCDCHSVSVWLLTLSMSMSLWLTECFSLWIVSVFGGECLWLWMFFSVFLLGWKYVEKIYRFPKCSQIYSLYYRLIYFSLYHMAQYLHRQLSVEIFQFQSFSDRFSDIWQCAMWGSFFFGF